MLTCHTCGAELTEDNWYASEKKQYIYECKSCQIKRVRDWRKNHPNAERHYRKGATTYMREYMREYRKSHPDKIHEIVRVEKHRRKRDLPTDTILNEHFKGAHLHHMTPSVALYIPIELHQSVPHNLKTGKGMNEINAKVMEWAKEHL